MKKIQKYGLMVAEQIIQIYVQIMDYQMFVHLHLMIAYAESLHGHGKSNTKN